MMILDYTNWQMIERRCIPGVLKVTIGLYIYVSLRRLVKYCDITGTDYIMATVSKMADNISEKYPNISTVNPSGPETSIFRED